MIIPGLFEELKIDPANTGYADALAANNDQAVADLGNNATVPVLGMISRTDLTKWGAKTGMRKAVQIEADDHTSPVCSLALAIIDVLRGSSGGIDFKDVDNLASLDAWIQTGKLTAENKALMLAMATQEVPRNVALFGRLLTANDIAWHVRDDLGNPLIGA